MQIGVGYSSDDSPSKAVYLAVEKAKTRTGNPSFTFIFFTDEYDAGTIFEESKKHLGRSKLVGASVPGIIVGTGVMRKGVGVLTFEGSEIEAITCLQEGISDNSFEQGQKTGAELKKNGLERGIVFVVPDGFATNISDLLRGLYDELDIHYSYAGGGAGDNLKFYKTFQFTEQGVSSTAVAAAILKGVEFQVASGHGWEPSGEPMMVTRAKGKTVYELDGLPAFKRYSESLGGIDKEHFSYYGMMYPLGIPSRKGEFLVRDPLFVNEDDSIELVSEIPENTIAMLMKGEVHKLIATADEVSRQVSSPGKQNVALLFDCISRYILLKEHFKQELEIVQNNIGADTPLFGILSFGEVVGTKGSPLFHNKSLVLAVG